MEEQDSRQQEVRQEVDQPTTHQHTPSCQPTLKLSYRGRGRGENTNIIIIIQS